MSLDIPFTRHNETSFTDFKSDFGGESNTNLGFDYVSTERLPVGDTNLEDEYVKAWNINDKTFMFSPKQTDQDSWSVLLDPLLKKDAIRCNSWKEEVENLLIFAGLFSAVVTAFLVETYQTLIPSSEDTIVLLLSQIADRLGNSSQPNMPSSTPSIGSDTNPRDIRINCFWLLSLILSLTTVLIGTITLQWLREHQTYPDLTPKQMFAVFRMRSEGMRRWYVHEIFVALPLLLQAALILFLAGMVDFSLSLGRTVALPVIVTISLTLFFLFVTTVVPTFQGLLFYIPLYYSRDSLSAPAPCPYKSPQSQAFRKISYFSFNVFSNSIPRLIRSIRIQRRRFLNSFYNLNLPDPEIKVHRIIPLLYTTWGQMNWTLFDLKWLTIRDEYAQGPAHSLIGSELYQEGWLDNLFPVFDVTLGIQEAMLGTNHQKMKKDIMAAYNCFEEVSLAVVDRVKELKQYYSGDTEQHHLYFQKLLSRNSRHKYPSLSEYIDSESSIDMFFPSQYSTFLHYGNMVSFLAITKNSRSLWDEMEAHISELKIRAMGWAYQVGCRTSKIYSDTDKAPVCLEISSDEVMRWAASIDTSDIARAREGYELSRQYLSMTLRFFESTESRVEGDWRLYINAHVHIPTVMANASFLTFKLVELGTVDANSLFSKIITAIRHRIMDLLEPSSQVVKKTVNNTDLLFYASALYLRPLATSFPWRDATRSHIYTELNRVLPVLARYKRDIFNYKGRSVFLENRFRGKDSDSIVRFSPGWWNFLDIPQEDDSSISSQSET